MATNIREAPINIRALTSQRELIDKAASILHKSRSDFMLEAACREAETILLDQRLFLVNDETYQAFETALQAPLDNNPGLEKLMKHPSPWEK